mmetsp:Transcript_102411/g.319033  ORF Transcript_102411/g.319033 Transcript_102411/m.319033 type:complete len:209 (-) Transcript_102411:163-789(-)
MYGRNLATSLALSSLMSKPLAFAMDARVSGDMLFIISSVAFSMSGSAIIAEGSMPPAGIAGMPPPPPPGPPLMLPLSFSISCICSGFMFFIISEMPLVKSGSEAICSAALRIMSACSLLLMFIFLRSSSLRSFVMLMAFWSVAGSSNILLRAAGSGAPPTAAAPAPARPGPWRASIFFRSSSGIACRASMAPLSMSGFFWICSIWLLS